MSPHLSGGLSGFLKNGHPNGQRAERKKARRASLRPGLS
jgi:hypothetical protein